MARSGKPLNLEQLTQLREQFEHALAVVGGVFDEPERYESGKDHTTRCIIECHVELEKPVGSSDVSILVRTRTKVPKVARRPHLARYHAGAFTFDPREQLGLFESPDRRTDG